MFAALFSTLATVGASAARADKITGDVGLVADIVDARHVLGAPPEDFVAPLPFFIADVKDGRASLDAQALTTFGSLEFGDQATRLDVITYSARFHFVPHVYAGLGITALDQTTTYAAMLPGQTAFDRSHLHGVRYEAGGESGRVELHLGLTPAIDGGVIDRCSSVSRGVTLPCIGQSTFTRSAPEFASEFDAAFRYAVPISRTLDAIAGLRYINFIGRITYPYETQTDQNRGAPLISLGLRYTIR